MKDVHKHSNCSHKHNEYNSLITGHSHAPNKYDLRFFSGILLNVIFIFVEIYYGKISNSSALLADALHNFSDVVGLFVSWGGVIIARTKATKNLTFALKNATIIASFINAVLLIIGVVYIFIESYKGYMLGEKAIPKDMILVAFVGIIINGLTALLFVFGAKNDINIKSAFLHMLSDALVSLGVVIAGAIIIFTNFYAIDIIVSVVIGVVIFISGYGLFKESLKLLFLGVPSNIKLKEVEDFILNFQGVISLHDLHIWALSTTQNSLTVHLKIENSYNNQNLIEILKNKFPLHHFTIQTENNDEICNYKC